MQFPKLEEGKNYIIPLINFLLIGSLFVIAFTGSLVSMATVEMEETDEVIQREMELIENDSARIKYVQINRRLSGGREIPFSCENQIIADQYLKQNKIIYFLENVPLIKRIDFLKLPEKVVLSIAATFMGLLGSIIILIKESVYNKLQLQPDLVLKRSLLGFSSGLLVIVLSYVLPGVLTFDSDVDIKIESLTTFSLLAGMFFKSLLEKVSAKLA